MKKLDSIDRIERASLKYINSEKGKETNQQYAKSENGKKARKKYYKSENGKKIFLRYYYSEKAIKNRLQRLELSKLTTQYMHFQKSNPNASFPDFLKTLKTGGQE